MAHCAMLNIDWTPLDIFENDRLKPELQAINRLLCPSTAGVSYDVNQSTLMHS